MHTLVPFDARNPNSRLSPVLSPDERREFAVAMLHDVLDAVRDAGGDPVILSTTVLDAGFVDAPTAGPTDASPDALAPVVVEDRPLSEAVGAHLTNADGSRAPRAAVVMGDLALATPAAIRRAYETPESGEVAAAPGLGGGTNVLVVRHRDFEPDYHGTSYEDHRRAAEDVGAPFRPVDSFRLAVDVDEPSDLPEVLLHGRGRARDWLEDAGFRVAVDAGRARIERASSS